MTNVWLPPLNASDVMTRTVVSVGPETPTREVAKLLLDKDISAVPVVDANGTAVGMVTESDLIRREMTRRGSSRSWWLEMLAEGEDLAPEFLDYLGTGDRPVREVMTAPVVAVAEDTPVQDIAEALQEHRIKRVPVLRSGRVVGIVSRADLLRALAKARGR
ncbi:MAG TPA: CBS domain-containing protein [Methylomirabilota bacterium]|nr:CBS domain-containing protein [Methylomirabilota bacterium]